MVNGRVTVVLTFAAIPFGRVSDNGMLQKKINRLPKENVGLSQLGRGTEPKLWSTVHDMAFVQKSRDKYRAFQARNMKIRTYICYL